MKSPAWSCAAASPWVLPFCLCFAFILDLLSHVQVCSIYSAIITRNASDLRLSGLLPSQDISGEARTRDRNVLADLRVGSLTPNA
ncbi:hypothetical protein PoB_003255300 [Plakobranchus ocellatus]|uniref:Secreted protein n=1 Tax=Plakobranchus ocellatus TaxID=259542 RepID=A0AAV4AGY4_9GAST|nr:hypothetical protein PoB_003255300 [Plakobranchus ocellatus]